MRRILSILMTVFVLSSLSGCNNSKENEQITNFYLSQPRDQDLVGWWAEWDDVNRDSLFHWYRADGVALTDLKYYNGVIDLRGTGNNNYWYTENNNIHR